jgi:hypothetical protein
MPKKTINQCAQAIVTGKLFDRQQYPGSELGCGYVWYMLSLLLVAVWHHLLPSLGSFNPVSMVRVDWSFTN